MIRLVVCRKMLILTLTFGGYLEAPGVQSHHHNSILFLSNSICKHILKLSGDVLFSSVAQKPLRSTSHTHPASTRFKYHGIQFNRIITKKKKASNHPACTLAISTKMSFWGSKLMTLHRPMHNFSYSTSKPSKGMSFR